MIEYSFQCEFNIVCGQANSSEPLENQCSWWFLAGWSAWCRIIKYLCLHMFFLAIFFNPNQNYIVLKKHFFEQVLGLTEGFEGALKLENPSMLLTLANPQELLLFKSHPQSTCVCVHIYYIRDIHTYNDTYQPPPADARGSASRITGFCF